MSGKSVDDRQQLPSTKQGMPYNKFSCLIIGADTLLIQCGGILLQRGHQIYGVISSEPTITHWAREQGIDTVRPGPDLAERLSGYSFDYLFSIANLSIISKEVLALPRKGAINFHDGPLPRYAGLHVTSWALMNQEKTHGITWHIMSDGVDEGDILKQRTVSIAKDETAYTLNAKCYEAGMDSFSELVDELAAGRVSRQKQNLAEQTYFSKYKRPDAACTIRWNTPADSIAAFVRSLEFGPYYPNALGLPKFVIGGKVFLVPKIQVADSISETAPGTITAVDENGLRVATASQEVVLREVVTRSGERLPVAELAKRVGASVGSQMDELGEEANERLTGLYGSICRHEGFWRKRLAGPRPIEIPYSDHSKRGGSSVAYNVVPMATPADVDDLLATTGNDVNRCDYLTAAVAAYLARLSGNYAFDVAFSHTTMREELTEFEDFFSLHVPLRVEFDPSVSFAEALESIQSQIAVTKKHKSYPYDMVLRYPELKSLQASDGQARLSVTIEQLGTRAQERPVSGGELTVLISEDGKTCSWVHDESVIDASRVSTMQRQFSTFLRNAAADSSRALAELSILTEAEHRQIVVEWNDTSIDYPTGLCIHEGFEKQVEKTPDAVAVVFEDQEITYLELNERANQLAHYLRRLEVGPETLVGIYMERSLEMMVALLGTLKAGGAYVPLDPTYPRERIAFMVEDGGVPVLLTQARLVNELPSHQARVVQVDADWDAIARQPRGSVDSGVTSENLGYVIFTSGSTGKPKGVMVCHRNVINFFAGMDQGISHSPPGAWLAVTSLSFDISVLELFWTLARGFKVVLSSDNGRMQVANGSSSLRANKADDDYSIAAQIQRHGVTHMQCTPSMAGMLVMEPQAREPLSSLREFMVGGETLPVSLARQLREVGSGRIVNMYGPTETTIWSTTYTVDEVGSTVPIGRPIANTQIYILDVHFRPVPVGVPGELFIGGAGVVRGYLNRPELTADRFVPDPFSHEPGARLYRTGDLARYLPDGNIEFLGRLDHQVKIRGHRIELGEIETVLEQHPAIREAIVLLREDLPGDDRLVAYLTLRDGSEPSLDELRSFLKEKLPDYMLPAAFVHLDALPLTPNGKVNRRALPAPDQAMPASEKLFVAPGNSLEAILAGTWAKLLGAERVGINDNFFDLGGNSLRAVRLISQLRSVFKVDLPLSCVLEAPTVAELSQVMIAHEPEPGQVEKIAQLMTKIGAMSEEEARETLRKKMRQREMHGEYQSPVRAD